MTTPDYDELEAINGLTRAAVMRERYVKGVYTKIINQLLRQEARLIQRIELRLEGLSGPDRARFQRDDWTTARLVSLREAIQELAKKYREIINGEIRQSARELIAAEIDLAMNVAGSLGVAGSFSLSEYQVYTAAMSQPFNGKHLMTYMKGVEVGVRRRVLESLRTSFANGESIPDAVKAIRGTKSRGYSDGIMDISRRGAATITRTAMTHMAAQTHEAVYADLGVQYVEYLAVLDSRTSDICMGLSRKKFKAGTDHPKPPMHLGCRSTLKPVVEGVPDTSQQTSRGPSGKTTYVDSSLNYGQWLRTQPRDFIEEALGKTKARLFLDGGLKLDKFVDLRRGKVYSIAELRSRYNYAFEQAQIAA